MISETKMKFAQFKFGVRAYVSKPSSHDCMDAGGRATQEQLPRDDLRELQGCIHAFSKQKP